MVDIWESVDPVREARQFCAVHGIDGPVLVDETGALAAELGIRGVPVNVLVDSDGTIREVGATTPTELRAAVDRLLQRSDW